LGEKTNLFGCDEVTFVGLGNEIFDTEIVPRVEIENAFRIVFEAQKETTGATFIETVIENKRIRSLFQKQKTGFIWGSHGFLL